LAAGFGAESATVAGADSTATSGTASVADSTATSSVAGGVVADVVSLDSGELT